jgi:hypothetical protein
MPTRGQAGCGASQDDWDEMESLRSHQATEEYVSKRDVIAPLGAGGGNMDGRCDECRGLLACEVEHLCHGCPDHPGADLMLLCGDCAAEHKDSGHDCRPIRD